jgi:hypothetical protein
MTQPKLATRLVLLGLRFSAADLELRGGLFLSASYQENL